MINVGIFGATGYTGLETLRLLQHHPQANLVFATSESYAGQTISQVYPVDWQTPLCAGADAPLNQVDAVFCCLPHAASMPTVRRAREAGVKVIDLSADFRLPSTADYQRWYQVEHAAPHLLNEAVYGLCEINRPAISQANLVANPGCYPTSVSLALYPLLQANWLDPHAPIIADSKSGVSGAGRKLSLRTHFAEANENLVPYNIGQNHRHLAEMEQIVHQIGQIEPPIIFSPHLVPINRGMLSTVYVTFNQPHPGDEVQTHFETIFATEPLVRVLPPGQIATFAHTQRTDGCALSITPVDDHRAIICAAIDNLGKGAAGQAVQNFNLMFNLPETTALRLL